MRGLVQAVCGIALAFAALAAGADDAGLRAEQAADAQALAAEQEAYRTRLPPRTPRAAMKLQRGFWHEGLAQQQLHERQRIQALGNRANQGAASGPGQQILRNAQRLQFRSEQAAQRQGLRMRRNSLPATAR